MPYIVDRFYSSSQKELKEDDPAADHMQAEGSLPPFPVSLVSFTINTPYFPISLSPLHQHYFLHVLGLGKTAFVLFAAEGKKKLYINLHCLKCLI